MINLDSLIQFIPLFIVSLLGAVLNDFYQTLSDNETEMKVARIMLSSITGALLILALSDYLQGYVNSNMFVLLSFISGATGFQIFQSLQKINLVNTFWDSFVKALRKSIIAGDDDDIEGKGD